MDNDNDDVKHLDNDNDNKKNNNEVKDEDKYDDGADDDKMAMTMKNKMIFFYVKG